MKIFDNPDFNDFKGGLTENYVNNQLIVNGLNIYYWTSGNKAEIDFVTRINQDIIPIEVKSDDNVPIFTKFYGFSVKSIDFAGVFWYEYLSFIGVKIKLWG